MAALKLHKRVLKRGLLVTSLLVMLTGCNSIYSINPSDIAQKSPDKVDPISLESYYSMEYLDLLWTASNHDDWDVLTAVIDPVQGGRVFGTPDSWPEEYEFGAYFPPNCLDSTEPFTVSLSVPQYDRDNIHPAVYLLEPHGIQFIQPVTVQLCFPYWLPSNEAYAKFNFWPEIVTGKNDSGANKDEVVPVYIMSDLERVTPSGENPRLGIIFQTTHFSRWAMSNGDGGGEELTFEPYREGRSTNR